MKILTKGNKDYYDYLMGIYGQDELVVYDRRDAFPIDPTKKWGDDIDRSTPIHQSDYQNFNIELWFKKEVLYCDKPKKEIKVYSSHKITSRKKWYDDKKHRRSGIIDKIMEGDIYHFILEVGYKQFFFEVERYVDDDDPNRLHLDYALIKTKELSKGDERLSYAPISLCPLNDRYTYRYFFTEDDIKITDDEKSRAILNPILYSTYIPKLISAEEIWRLLYEYISSLKDIDFEDTRTNDQHIESHGFDKKISFRHRK